MHPFQNMIVIEFLFSPIVSWMEEKRESLKQKLKEREKNIDFAKFPWYWSVSLIEAPQASLTLYVQAKQILICDVK